MSNLSNETNNLLKEIKKELQDIRSILEPKEIMISFEKASEELKAKYQSHA